MKKKILILGSIFLFFLAIGFAFWFFYIRPVKPIIVNRPSEMEKKMFNSVSDEEVAAIKGKNDPEIEAYFNKESEQCKQDFSGLGNKEIGEIKRLIPGMLKINFSKAENFVMCSGVKEGKADECSLLPEYSQNYGECRKNVILFSEIIFPSLRTGACNQEAVSACEAAGEKDCQELCQGLIFSKKKEDCANLPDKSFIKTTCLAINGGDINFCNVLTDERDLDKCQNYYYFITAVRKNNPGYLDYLIHKGHYGIFQLYFDSQYDCRKMIDKFGEEKCPDFYSSERFKLLLDIEHKNNESGKKQ